MRVTPVPKKNDTSRRQEGEEGGEGGRKGGWDLLRTKIQMQELPGLIM